MHAQPQIIFFFHNGCATSAHIYNRSRTARLASPPRHGASTQTCRRRVCWSCSMHPPMHNIIMALRQTPERANGRTKQKWNIVANIFRHLDTEEPSTLYYGAASNRVTSRLTGGWGKALASIVLLQCDATFMRKTSFCQIGNHIHKNMPLKPQVRFHYATFTL